MTHCGAREKVRGSPKSLAFILKGLCVQNLGTSLQYLLRYFSLDQSGEPTANPRAMSLQIQMVRLWEVNKTWVSLTYPSHPIQSSEPQNRAETACCIFANLSLRASNTSFWKPSRLLSNHHWTFAHFFCPVFTTDKDTDERGSLLRELGCCRSNRLLISILSTSWHASEPRSDIAAACTEASAHMQRVLGRCRGKISTTPACTTPLEPVTAQFLMTPSPSSSLSSIHGMAI